MTPKSLLKGIAVLAVAVATLNLSITSSSAQDRTENPPDSHYPYQTPLLMTVSAATLWAIAGNNLATDKKRHFSVSALFGAGSEFYLRRFERPANNRLLRLGFATGLGIIPGIIKEATDDRFDTNDMAANIAGALAGALISDLLQGPTDQSLAIDVRPDALAVKWSRAF